MRFAWPAAQRSAVQRSRQPQLAVSCHASVRCTWLFSYLNTSACRLIGTDMCLAGQATFSHILFLNLR
jgi:hypothetical protein